MDLTGVLAVFEAGGTPLVRTDFSSGEAWQLVVAAVTRAVDFDDPDNLDSEEGYRPHVVPIDDPRFAGVSPEALASGLGIDRGLRGYALLADSRSMHETEGADTTVVYVDLTAADPDDVELFHSFPGRSFRCPTQEIGSIEANLSIANMDFADFADSADPDGVFRGFTQDDGPRLVIPEAEVGIAAGQRIGRDVDRRPGARTPSGRVTAVHVERPITGTRRKLFEVCAHLRTWSHVWMPAPSWGWIGGPDEGVGAEDWAFSYDHPDQLTGARGAVKTTFLEIDKPYRAVREWQWMVPPGPDEARIDKFVPFLAEPTIMTVTLTQTRNADGEAETLIQIDHDRVPVEWSEDLSIYWAYQLSIADHAHFGTSQ